MIRSTVLVFIVFSSVIAACLAVPSSYDKPTGNIAVQIYTDVAIEDGTAIEYDESRVVTPFGYKAMMLQNSSGRKLACWRCSSPCSAYMCCDDGYPQCCLVSGRCRCCR